MSRTGHRRRQPTRGRTASTPNDMLSAKGVRKSGGTTKVPSRSGSTRGSSAGPAQHRKSEENPPNVHNRVPSKTRNENVPMHDSSNNSTLQPPQPVPSNPIKGKGRYTDRFGHIHPITIDLTQPPITTTISSNNASAQNNNNEQQPKTDSVDTSEPTANNITKDRTKINEVCRKFLHFQCVYGDRCDRLHPVELLPPRPIINEICRDFARGYCRRVGYCNRIHTSPQRAKPDDSTGSTESNPLHTSTNATGTGDVPTNKGGDIDNAAGIIDAETPVSVPTDVKNIGVPVEIKVEQPLTASLSSESRLEAQGLPTHNLRLPQSPKEICRNYLIDRCLWDRRCHRFHPPEAERLQLLEAERSRPKLKEVCQHFLRNRCYQGVLCNYTHARPDDTKYDESTTSSKICPIQSTQDSGETSQCLFTTKLESISVPIPQKTAEPCGASENDQYHNSSSRHLQALPSTSSVSSVIATPRQDAEEIQSNDLPLNTPNGTPEANGIESTHKTKARSAISKPREACKRYLDGIKHNERICRYFHPPLDQQQNPSANKQVNKAILVEESSDSDSDTDTSSVEHRSFSRSQVDTSNTTDTPLVNIPKDRFLKKAGRKKKKKVPKKVSSSSASITTEETIVVHSDTLFADVPTFAELPVGNEVVKLPSPQNCSNPSTGHGGCAIGQPNGGSVTGGAQHSNLAFSAESFSGISTSGPHTTCGNITRAMPPHFGLCIDWLRGRCSRDKNCKYLHVNPPGSHNHNQVAKYNERDSANIQAMGPPQIHSEQDKFFPPCLNRDQCESVPALSDSLPSREPPPHMTVTVLEHTKVNLGAGFEIKDVTTGFESRWVILGNIPSGVTEKTIRRTLKVFGQVDDLRMPATSSTSFVNIKALFSSAAEAIQAAGALNGAQIFSRRISARLPLNNTTRGNGTFQDCSVRIEWDVPGRMGYAGYPGIAEAEAAVSAADGFTFRDSCINASIYEGLPALGAVNVRFAGLPPTAEAQDLKQFGAPEAIMLERPNYMSIGIAAKAIQGLLKEVGEVLSFDLPPPPHRDRVVRAWAHFTSPTLAQTASAHLNGRRPYFIGKGKLSARHVRALSYTLPVDAYDKLASDVTGLRHSFWRQGRGAVLSVVDRRVHRQHDPAMPVFIKLSGEDVGALGHLKAEFEKLLHGEILMQDGKVIWDGFLERSAGSAFIYEVERANPGVSIQKSIGRRTITLFGPISKRRSVRRVIVDKINRIRAQQTWVIPLAGRLIGLFMSAELMALQQSLGHENVILNLLRCTLTVRGNDAAYEAAQRAVHQVQKRHLEDRKGDIVECPVCFNQVVSPITLQCGHSWCKSCLSNYFVAATDNKIFPLRCLGAEATCSQLIPVAIARDILCANEFDAVVNASFHTYIYARPDEFHYCPTPDCPQIYRSAPPDTILQCPSCLTRICPSCHVEAHDGLTCAIRDVDGEKLFKEWMDAHDVKSCPGCKAAIERIEGCNHMTCSRCQTHICWVCMETFPKGEGVYDHMRMAHGGIGL